MTQEDIRRVDTDGMYEAVRNFPVQWSDGRRRALAADWSGVHNNGHAGVLIVGMGGSAIAGDLLRTLTRTEASVPITVLRSYSLPAWVSPDTTVIASSYSGNTEETLSALDVALDRGASVVCITTGGRMASRADEAGVPLISLPAGLQPRAALGHSLTALCTVAERLGLLTASDEDWQETRSVLDAQKAAYENPEDPDNEAMKMAIALRERLPVIYSSERLEGANLRWRNQMHENSKTFAVGNLFPEMNHNEIMGWARHAPELRRLGVILLRDREDHARVQRRMEITRDLLKDAAGYWTEVQSQGTSRLARLMSLLYVSDWVSLYLAILHEVDPSPVGLISQLKAALATPQQNGS